MAPSCSEKMWKVSQNIYGGVFNFFLHLWITSIISRDFFRYFENISISRTSATKATYVYFFRLMIESIGVFKTQPNIWGETRCLTGTRYDSDSIKHINMGSRNFYFLVKIIFLWERKRFNRRHNIAVLVCLNKVQQSFMKMYGSAISFYSMLLVKRIRAVSEKN